MNFNKIASLAVIISHMLISFAVMSHHHGGSECCSESCSYESTGASVTKSNINAYDENHHQCLFCRSIILFQKDFQINVTDSNNIEILADEKPIFIPYLAFHEIIPSNGRSPPLS